MKTYRLLSIALLVLGAFCAPAAGQFTPNTLLESITLTAQPGAPGDLEQWGLPLSGLTGADWPGNEGKIAQWSSVFSIWAFHAPTSQSVYVVVDEQDTQWFFSTFFGGYRPVGVDMTANQVFYVAPDIDGPISDTGNDGLNRNHPYATLAALLGDIGSGTATSPKIIQVIGGGPLSGSLTLPDYVKVIAPEATLVSSITLGEGSMILVDVVEVSGTDYIAKLNTGVGHATFRANVVINSGTSKGFRAGVTNSNLVLDIGHLRTTNATAAIGSVSPDSDVGLISGHVERATIENAAGVLVRVSSGGEIALTFGSIDENAVRANAIVFDVDGDQLSVDVVGDITTGGKLYDVEISGTLRLSGSGTWSGTRENAGTATLQEELNKFTSILVGPNPIANHTLAVDGEFILEHTATEPDDHAMQITVDAAGFGDVKALDIDYITGAIADGEDEEVILINIDESLATGGDVAALEVLSTEGDANIFGLFVGALVNPIEQLSGRFADADTVLDEAADVTTELSDGGAGNIAVFTNNSETMTVGSAAKFEEIESLLDTVASGAGIKPTWEFSTGVGTWATFSPADGTNGMRNNGVTAWLDSDIPTWAVGTGTEYLIRITRTQVGLTTTPIMDKVQIAATVVFFWDKDGNIEVLSVSTDTITERTAAAGVTIDSLLIKDGVAVMDFGDLDDVNIPSPAAFDVPLRNAGNTLWESTPGLTTWSLVGHAHDAGDISDVEPVAVTVTQGVAFPVSPSEGDMHYHTIDNELYIYESTRAHWLGAPQVLNFGRNGTQTDGYLRMVDGMLCTSTLGALMPYNVVVTEMGAAWTTSDTVTFEFREDGTSQGTEVSASGIEHSADDVDIDILKDTVFNIFVDTTTTITSPQVIVTYRRLGV